MKANPLPTGTKTKAQVARIWGLARSKQMNDELLHSLVLAETNKHSIRLLSKDEADKVIVALGGEALTQARGNSKRTQQARARKANVTTLINDAQRGLIAVLARKRWGAEAAPATLEKLCLSTIKRTAPLTSIEAIKMIQALRGMNRRDGIK